MSDPGKSHCGWETALGGRHTDIPCGKNLGIESLFSGYWEGISVRGYRGRERKNERDRDREEEERG